jgi:hypothetical protein
MENVTEVISFIKTNWVAIVGAWLALVGFAEYIVKFTETEKDNYILHKIKSTAIKIISIMTKFGFDSKAK